ncbi:MAG: hypothetical protein GY940_13550 [bacterium]|nr:hypothetical protein [bacterium]
MMNQSKQPIPMSVIFLVSLVLVLFTAVSCGKSGEVRKYKEKAAPVEAQGKDPHGNMKMPNPGGGTGVTPDHGQGKPHFQWDTPEGWDEKRASSGIRLATFTVKSGDLTSECTIIPLSGDAGGLKANVARWLGQMTSGANASAPMMSSQGDPAVVEQLMKNQEQFLTKGQFAAVLIDYTAVTAKDTDSSILASAITMDTSTVFIKMVGPKSLLVANKAKFKALCQSFNMGTPPAALPGKKSSSTET